MNTANNQAPDAAKFVTNNYWLVAKQQYNAAKNSWKTFPEYEAKLRNQLNDTFGSIAYEDEYAFVFNGKEPRFSNIGRKVEVCRCYSAGDSPPSTLFGYVGESLPDLSAYVDVGN
jgi:hypothetical protein